MTRLLYITNGVNGVGGLERVLSVKTKLFIEKKRYEIHIAGLKGTDSNFFYEFDPSIVFHSMQISGNPIVYMYRYISEIHRLIKKVQPDIVIVCDDGLKAFITPFIRGKKIPIVYERHVSNHIFFNDNQSFLEKLMVNIKVGIMNYLSTYFSVFVVLNEGNKEEWSNKGNIRVIENILSFSPKTVSSLENKKVIAVGKQSYQKNYERMIDIWKDIAADYPDWQLHIYGKKNDNINLEEKIISHHLENKVVLCDPDKNIMERYLESSIFLMTSRYEGQPMVLLEAMACGLPSVCFDFDHGPREIIGNGKDGFVVPYKDDKEFTDCLKSLLGSLALRKQLGRNAKISSEKFSRESVFMKWDHLFKSLMRKS
ncbi:glycosyltransferase family 4 protein [Chryseobacterium sp. NEB161]|nr:glycosyltransferase family 4 protein [Chryseobacterium sp. NEB161]